MRTLCGGSKATSGRSRLACSSYTMLANGRRRRAHPERLASSGRGGRAGPHGLQTRLPIWGPAPDPARHRVDAPAARERLDAIIVQVDRLDVRIAHLLQFSRPAPFHPLRESVRTLVEGALSGFAELLRLRGIELVLRFAEAVPDVRVDPMRLEQALTEIVSNALDAMSPPAGGRLEIGAHVATGDAGGGGSGAGVVIAITDSGRGIPAEILPNLCEPFFTTRSEGTGLGLAIAQRYVEEAGGRLEITSVVGRGTTVRIWLPVASRDPVPAPQVTLA